MKLKLIAALILLSVVGFTGCSTDKGAQIDPTSISKIQKGVTTKTELLAQYGTPTSTEITSEGKEKLSWQGQHNEANGKMFIPFVGPYLGTSNASGVTLEVVFDKDGKVESYSYSKQQYSNHL